MLPALMRVVADAVELVHDGTQIAVAFPGSRRRFSAADRSADLSRCRASRAAKPCCYATRSGKARMTAAVRLETFSRV